MDRTKLVGLALMCALFFGFTYMNSMQQEKIQARKAAVEAASVVEQIESKEEESVAAQSVEETRVVEGGESLIAASGAAAESIVMENDVMRVDFSTRGAIIRGVELRDYTKYAEGERTELVQLMDPATAKMDLSFYIRNGLNNLKINTMDYTFEAQPVVEVAGGKQLSMSLSFDSGAKIEYIYTLYNTESEARNYMLDFEVKLHNMTPILANQSSLVLNWANTSYQNERGFSNENTYTTVAYHHPAERGMEELKMGTESERESVATAVDWVAFKQQFFTSAIIAQGGGVASADLSYQTAAANSGYIKNFAASMVLPLTPTTEGYSFALYYGPNKYSTLRGVNDLGYGELTMEELVPLGWGIFGWVNRWFVIPVFDLLRGHIASFGVIILILTILIKLLISPLTYKSYLSMAKMRVLKPQMDEIAARYPKAEDAQKKQKATMDLYSKAGVNPLGGCLPMLIQMPILIAMFRFFPSSIELRGQSFLWAQDLSSYDSVLSLPFEIPFYGDHVSLFALLMSGVLFAYSLMNYNQSASSQPQMAGMKFMMVYMMPVMMLLWFNSYSSGLCYYYFLSNLITIAQTILTRRFVNDDKILAIMAATAAKNKDKKKSKFQLNWEAAMAEQERKAGKK